jgi:hypothetical protein
MLEDGDGIVVGRYRLRFLSVAAEPLLDGARRVAGLNGVAGASVASSSG